MIEILINGQPLAVPADLTLTMEQSAPWYDPDNISADTIFTFDLPAEPNALILDHAQSTVISHHRRYPCQVTFGSMPIANGQLYVQTTKDEQHLSCGITFNPFGIGWGETKLSDNDYGAPTEIVRNGLESFKQDWRDFLRSTLSPDSHVKFMLFCDDLFSDDEDYSYFRNEISPLEDTLNENRFRSYVNRLFFGADNTILETPVRSTTAGPFVRPVSVKQGVRIFNSDSGAANGHKVNGYRFAPALRLVWLTRQILASANKRISGTWTTDTAILQLFVQSLCSMDGDVRQYPVARRTELANLASVRQTGYGNSCLPFTLNGNEYDTFRPIQGASTPVTISYQLLLPVDDLAKQAQDEVSWYDVVQFDQYDEAYYIAALSDASEHPILTQRIIVRHPDHPSSYITIGESAYYPSSNQVRGAVGTDVQFIPLTSTTGNEVSNDNDDIGGYTIATARSWVAVQQYLNGSQDCHLYLVKAKAYNTETVFGYYFLSPSGYGPGPSGYNYNRGDVVFLRDIQVIDTSTLDYNDTPLNIYAKELDLSQHVPSLTNGQYLSELAKFFGLNLWIVADTDEVQLDFFADIFRSKSIVLDDYIYYVQKQNYEPKNYEAKISPTLPSGSIRPDYILDPIDSRAELPDANLHKNRHIFICNENAYLRSMRTKDQHGTLTSKYHWEQAGAADATLTVGPADGTPSTHTSAIQVANMRIVDTDGTPKYLHEIPARGVSPMFDDDYNGEFPMVITQYRGRRLINLQPFSTVLNTYSFGMIEYANPTNYNADGTTDPNYINLTATGPQSVGELWLKPYLHFLATAEPFEFTARLPIHLFFQLLTLMRPQDGSPAQQTRWISYRQQRYLPSRITYTITHADTVVATIHCHREQLFSD